jgi:hypothetical protein
MSEAFKFPDEIEEKPETAPAAQVESDEVEIEVVDDTPPEDQNRKPLPPKQVEEAENDDLEEYSEKAKYRLAQMKKGWHDERRAKEQAAREREEALRYAVAKDREIKELRKKLGAGEKLFVDEVSKAVNNDIATAKERLKRAYEAGDADSITDAQEALTDAKLKLRDVMSIRPSQPEPEFAAPQQESEYSPQPELQAQPQRDPKAEGWRSKNTWFGVNRPMTAFAFGLHEQLEVAKKLDPFNSVDIGSDEYYAVLDSELRKRFPEQFEDVQETKTQENEPPQPRAKPSAVVASVTRATGPKRIRLKASELALAKRLGLTPELYAKEMMKLENTNG